VRSRRRLPQPRADKARRLPDGVVTDDVDGGSKQVVSLAKVKAKARQLAAA